MTTTYTGTEIAANDVAVQRDTGATDENYVRGGTTANIRNSTDIDIRRDQGWQFAPAIAQHVAITEVVMEYQNGKSVYDDVDCLILVHDDPDGNPWPASAGTDDVQDRTRQPTNMNVAWAEDSIGGEGVYYEVPSGGGGIQAGFEATLRDLAQRIIADSGWASGQHLTFLFNARSAADKLLTVDLTSTERPKVSITYEDAAAQIAQVSLSSSSGTAHSVTFRTPPLAGNLLTVAVKAWNEGSTAMASAPTGWTKEYDENVGGDRHGLYYKISDGTETSFTITGVSTFWSIEMVEHYAPSDENWNLIEITNVAASGAVTSLAGTAPAEVRDGDQVVAHGIGSLVDFSETWTTGTTSFTKQHDNDNPIMGHSVASYVHSGADSSSISPTWAGLTSNDGFSVHLIQWGKGIRPDTLAAPATVLAPTLTTTVDITPGVITAAASVLAPEVTAAAAPQAITPGAISAPATVEAPTVTTVTAVTAAVVAAPDSVLAPTITATVSVTPAVVAAAATVLAPTVVAVPPAQAITPAAVSAPASVQAPTVTTTTAVTAPAVAAAANILTPSVTAGVTLLPAVVAAPATVLTPTVIPDQAITPAVVSAPATVQAPTLTTEVPVTSPVLAAPATILDLVVTIGSPLAITPAVVAAPDSILAPTVSTAYAVAPDALTAPSTVYAPEVLAGAQIVPGVVSAPATVLAPVVAAAQQITSPVVSAPATVPDPAVLNTQQLTPGVVAAPASVPDPAVASGYPITPPAVAAPASVLDPTITTTVSVTPDAIVAPATVPTPTVTSDTSVVVPVINSPSTVLAPQIIDVIVLDVIAAPATLHVPTIIQEAFLVAPVLDAAASILAPVVATAATLTASRFTTSEPVAGITSPEPSSTIDT